MSGSDRQPQTGARRLRHVLSRALLVLGGTAACTAAAWSFSGAASADTTSSHPSSYPESGRPAGLLGGLTDGGVSRLTELELIDTVDQVVEVPLEGAGRLLSVPHEDEPVAQESGNDREDGPLRTVIRPIGEAADGITGLVRSDSESDGGLLPESPSLLPLIGLGGSGGGGDAATDPGLIGSPPASGPLRPFDRPTGQSSDEQGEHGPESDEEDSAAEAERDDASDEVAAGGPTPIFVVIPQSVPLPAVDTASIDAASDATPHGTSAVGRLPSAGIAPHSASSAHSGANLAGGVIPGYVVPAAHSPLRTAGSAVRSAAVGASAEFAEQPGTTPD
ncbi:MULTISPECIES: hypothetical protein [Actinoalloteichus]|uniref:Uncharacterized protein n=1 Tax=Actinoalloteichus fjordicus TaxID=1612552 RepID=A0AAC9LI67_9PSEU|nr:MULTISPECIES: hypothetical protein [Actinoalloteichus]APU18012.1 hypothetical protein UA74_30105 [Actinoalloteichus fjordicus]APU24091.1 hypothetical protein UA75_30640 [Actinoalloteichus sp. GBA129-24]